MKTGYTTAPHIARCSRRAAGGSSIGTVGPRSGAFVLAMLAAACPYQSGTTGDDSPATDGPPATVDGPPGSIDAPPAIDAPPPPPDAQVDARPCPAAPAGCTPFSCGTPSCYYVCPADDWPDAQARCQGSGVGCLVTIDDDLENVCIDVNTNPAYPDLVWFGFVQASSGSEPSGSWGWACGSSSYTAPNWGMFEPNDEGNEDCGAMNASGVWIDGDCDTSLRYVCEVIP
jgi:hypothetical protein